MKKVIVLTEVAHLPTNVKGESLSSHAFQDEYSKELDRENETGIDTADSFDYSEAPESILSRENSRLASSVQIEISELLEQWDEQELQGKQEEEVSLVSFGFFFLSAGNSLLNVGSYYGVDSAVPTSPGICQRRVSFFARFWKCPYTRKVHRVCSSDV
jgi:hypothetical protein